MATITFWLSDEEINQLRQLQRLRNETGSIHSFAKRIVQEYIQGKIRSLAFEKAMKEVALELNSLRAILQDFQLKLEEKTENKNFTGLLEEILEKLEKFQERESSQRQQGSEVLDILSAIKELGIRVLLLSDKRKEFELIVDNLIQKYRKGGNYGKETSQS